MADLNIVLASFRSAYQKRARKKNPNLIEFNSSPSCKEFISTAGDSGTCKYLIRPQYSELWKLCEDRLLSKGSPTRTQTVIVGTAGIGKSAARLFYICTWLENESPAMARFERVVFNFGNQHFAVNRNGSVAIIDVLLESHLRSLMLLDPCDFLHNVQNVACAMLVVFASPSSLVSQPNKPNLSGLSKTSECYVLDPPTVEDLKSLGISYSTKRLENFSWVKDGIRYCALRWFTFADSHIPGKLGDCLTQLSMDGLYDWFINNSKSHSLDCRLPFRLCVVEKGLSTAWTVAGFISPAIEQYLFEWSLGVGRRQVHQMANILNNRALRGGLGIFYERWLFDQLGQGTKLTLSDQASEISFQELKYMDEYSIGSEDKVVYMLDRANFPSIEGYAVDGQSIYFLQSTVSTTHKGARYDDVKQIVAAVAGRQKMDLVVVYITPRKVAFQLPTCVGFPARTKVLHGSVDDTDFLGMVPPQQRLGLDHMTAKEAGASASGSGGCSAGGGSDSIAAAASAAGSASASGTGHGSGVQGIAGGIRRRSAEAAESAAGRSKPLGSGRTGAGRGKKARIAGSEVEDNDLAPSLRRRPKKGP